MAITYSPEEYIAALGDLTPLVNEAGGLQGIDILNQYARPGSGYNIPNGGLGGFSPATDPNYSSGQNYARSIAGGMPMSQIMSPGVSYSPGDPTGYTQLQLNTPMQAPIPPKQEFREPDDTSFLGKGIGNYSMPFDRKQQLPPVEKIFGNIPSGPAQTPGLGFGNIDIDAIRQQIADSGIDFTNLFGLPSQPDFSQFVTQEDLPGMIPQVPNGSDFSIDRLDLPDFKNFLTQEDLPVYDQPDLSQFITQQDLPQFDIKDYRDDFLSIAREGIDIPSYEQPDLSQFITQQDLPAFNPQDYRDDFLSIAREGIDMPQFDASGLQSQIAQNQNLIAGMPKFDPQNYRDDFLSIAREGIDMPQFDPSGLQQQIGGLEQQISSMPQFNPQDYRDDFLSIAREGIEMPQYQAPDLSGFAKLSDIPSFDPSALKQDILSSLPQQAAPDLSGFMTQEDINKAISGINMPQYQAPDLSGYDTRLADLEKTLMSIQQPVANDRFSVNQLNPRGLF